MFAVRPCLHPSHPSRRKAFWNYSDGFLSKLLSLYEKKQARGESSDFLHLFFQRDCFSRKSKRDDNLTSGVMLVHKEDLPIDCTIDPKKKRAIRNWLEECKRYLMRLPFPQLYMLLQLELQLEKKRRNQFCESNR